MRRTLALSGLAFLARTAPPIDCETPTYTGSPSGTLLSGQDGWYNPIKGSTDWNVYTYADNAMGIVANPAGGGDQFAIASRGGKLIGQRHFFLDGASDVNPGEA